MSAKAHFNKMKAQGKVGRGGRVVTPIDRNRFPNREREGLEGPFRNRKTSLIYYYDKKAGKYYDPQSDMYLDVKDVMDSVEEGLRQDLKQLKKNEGLRQAMSGPRETPAQKRKRKEKDNFDLYKKKQRRVAALRGDKSSRKLTPGQEKHYRQTVNLSQIKALSGVKKESIYEQPEHEITVGNYTTKFFYMCGSAQKTMKKHANKEGAEELTKLQDDFYKLEKAAMDAGGATDEQKSRATNLYTTIMAKAKEVGIGDEVNKYMKLHLDSMLKGEPKLGFGRTDVSEDVINEDRVMERELELFIVNDANIYRQRITPIIKNLSRKKKSGKYDNELAKKAFIYAVNDGIKSYNKEFGSGAMKLDKTSKMKVASELLGRFSDEIK
jgi:hypothetical protein